MPKTKRIRSLARSTFARATRASENEVPAYYTYEELDQDSNQIRLIRLLPSKARVREHHEEYSEVRCELFHANLDDHPAYKALSYTWGSQFAHRHTIYINGCCFEVRENLWHALNRFQSDNIPLVIWIDALCINQSSNTERNHQVAKMKMIYEQAVEVVAWLGPSYHESHLAFQIVAELYEHRESPGWVTERFSKPDMEQMLKSLGKLLGHDYWWRMWVVQEIVLAKNVVICCGDDSMEGKCLHAVQKLFVRIIEHEGFSRDHLLQAIRPADVNIRNILLGLGIKPFLSWKEELISTKPSFYECMLHHFYKVASDPRDLIYGLAALANRTSPYKIEVDYGLSPRAVFTNFAKLEIETSRKLDIITRVLPDFNTQQLPSWVPDWSRDAGWPEEHESLYDMFQPELRFYAAGQSESEIAFKEDFMTFKGINIGYIDLLGPRTNMTGYGSRNTRKGISALRTSWEFVAIMDGASVVEHEAFARTITCNKMWKKRHFPGITKSRLLEGILGYISQVFLDSFPEQTGNSILSEYWNSHLAFEKESGRHDEVADRRIMHTWMEYSFRMIWDRRFFISSLKSMGLAAKEVTEGDLICIPLGCCHPVILRKVEDHYINLGEAYVDGFMYGEAMEMVEKGELKVEEFTLR